MYLLKKIKLLQNLYYKLIVKYPVQQRESFRHIFLFFIKNKGIKLTGRFSEEN